MQTAIDRVFDDFSNHLPNSVRGSLFDATGLNYDFPKTDVSEADDKVEIEVELPGIEQKDVDVTLDGQYLIIKGERHEEKKTEKKNYRIVERSRGDFQRMIPLGFEAESEAVDASFSKGVLTVTVVKPPEAVTKAKKIDIRQPEPA